VSLKSEFFGKFILLDKIATGGMAEVYRAKAPGAEGIGKILAIKRILPQYSSNSEFIEMFKGEAKIAVNLTQANIGQIYEFGEEQGQFYLLMEFIDGRNLRQILSRCSKLQKALTIEQCVYIIAQVSNGLDYAHRCTNKNTGTPLNIIHRDMSPQNIMVSFEGETKIIDFGIAKAESKIDSTRAGTLKGKFGYMSPEQAEGMDLDARTDIFSTGIVLWELLSGERLFVANNEVNTIRKIRECQIPSLKKINPNIPDELERIAMKALAKDRSLRFQTAAELYRDLSRFLYKVNPEFTQHELSVFTKSLFKDEILEDRKRVAEFVRITFPQDDKKKPVSVETKTFTDASTATETHPTNVESPAPFSLSSVMPKEAKSLNFGPTSVENKAPEIKIANDASQSNASNIPSLSIVPAPASPKETPRNLVPESNMDHGDKLSLDIESMKKSLGNQQQQQQNSSQNRSSAPGTSPLTRTGFTMTSSYNKRTPRDNPLARVFPILLLISTLSASAYYVLIEPDKLVTYGSRLYDMVLPKQKMVIPSVVPTPAVPKEERAEIFVTTIPAGATIDVNGENMGTTPSTIKVPLKKQVSISLRKDGYLVYSKEHIVTRSPDEIQATLQRTAVGYLDIEVRPTGNTIDIFVNGQKLSEKPPIKRYAVPAGKTLVVKAVNPYANTSDQTSVSVRQDSVQPVKLFLTKQK
jgi:eukaryotic-like serine/threonine-protein kinase